ncbi:hypothetical protein JCM11641_007588 [Rhodosporidiobolus odoratus]
MVRLPPSDQLLDSIRTSCAASTTRAAISIDHQAIDTFIQTVGPEEWSALTGAEAHGVRLPLRFDSPEDEVNLVATLGLLNFLSGYRTPLHRLTGRGAYSAILSLVLSSYLSGSTISSDEPSLLSAAGLRSVTPAALAGLARIKTHNEKPHPTLGPAVTVGEKDEEAWEILELLANVCVQTGAVLQRESKATLGEWVVAKLNETQGDVAKMVHALASTFPAFADAHVVDGEPVYLFKKALWLLTVITLRFADEKPSFPLPEVDDTNLPIFADNVLPSLLVHHGIISLSASTHPSLSALSLADPSTLLLPHEAATGLRAASLTACSAMVIRAHELAKDDDGVSGGKEWLSTWTERKLDGFLWNWGKGEEGKAVARVGERGTVYY